MPINILSESGAYDPSPSRLWEQDSQAESTVGRSLFRIPTTGLGAFRNSFGGSNVISYDTLRNAYMPNALDFFLSEGLVYFHHIIDTSSQPFVSGTITPGFPPTILSIPVCGNGAGPDIGYATNGGEVSIWSATPSGGGGSSTTTDPTTGSSSTTTTGLAAWCSGGPSNGTMYGTPGATQAIRSTTLRPGEGRGADGRVGGYPELFCVDSTTQALMIQLLPGGRDPVVGEQVNFTSNLGSRYSSASGAISAYRFNATYTLQRANYSFSTRVVDFYKMSSLGYHMLQLSGNFRCTADQVINFNGLNFKVIAGGGIATRAALFGRWEFDRKKVYWEKMRSNNDFLSRGKITENPQDVVVNPDAPVRDDIAKSFGNELLYWDKSPPTKLAKDTFLGAFPEKNEPINYNLRNVSHNFSNIETTSEISDNRTAVTSQSVQHLNAAGVSSSNYTNLPPANVTINVEKPGDLPTGDRAVKDLSKGIASINENIDKTNKHTKDNAVEGLEFSSRQNEDLNSRSGSTISTSTTGNKVKIYGPTNRFDLVPKYEHPEYTMLQRYDPDERRDRTFTFTFGIDFESMACGPCVCIEQTTTSTDPVTGTETETTEIITCSSATTPSDVSFTATKVILNNLTPEANIWKQITKNYNGSLQGVTYESLEGRNQGSSDPSTSTEGDAYWNTNSKKTRIYKNGKWEDADTADFKAKKEPKTVIQPVNEDFLNGKRGEYDQFLKEMTLTTTTEGRKTKTAGGTHTKETTKEAFDQVEKNAKDFNKEADEINKKKD